MAGFNPASRKKQSGYANGGMVRGPGSGISDDIKKKVAPGSYIMPADSTHEIGEEALQEMGEPKAEESKETLAGEKAETKKPEKGEPVNLSNGEYELPPEQVHALGLQMLDMVKNATHTPVGRIAQGFKPDPSFANGGIVEDRIKPGETGWRSSAVMAGANEDIARLKSQGKTAQAAGTEIRALPTMAAAGLADAGEKVGEAATAAGGAVNRAVIQPVANFGKGLLGVDDSPPPAAVGFKPSAPPASIAASSAVPALPGIDTAPPKPMATPAQAGANLPVAQAAAEQPAASNNIKREMVNGVPSFSADGPIGDGFTINGQKPKMGMTVVPSSAFTGGNNPGAMQASGFRPAAQQESGPRLAVIGDNRQGNALQNKALSAASTAYEGSPNGQLTANQVKALVDMRNSDQNDATHRYTTDVNNQTAMDRVSLQEDGANYRADTADQSANNRFAATNTIEKGKLGLETEAQGFKTRAAQREEKLYQQYDAAKTPEERSAIAQSIRDLSGKSDNLRDNFMTVGGGQEYDQQAMTMRNVPQRLIDLRTGNEVGGGDRAPPPIDQNPAALAIKNNSKLSREERVAQLRALGYQ